MARTAYDEQLGAMEDVYDAKRREAKEELTQADIDAWGRLAEGQGMSGSNIKRLQSMIVNEATTRLGGINAEERMFFANIRRAEEERKKQSTRNIWSTVGTVAGIGAGLALAPLSGGLSLALPTIMAGAGLGTMLGGLGGGLATGEMEAGVGAMGIDALNAAGSSDFQRQLNDMLAGIRRNQSLLEPFDQDDTTTWGNR